MNIDDEFYNKIVSLYEDDLDEKQIQNKLKRLSASEIIDLKNSFDNDDFERVDMLMRIPRSQDIQEEVDRMLGLEAAGRTVINELKNLSKEEIEILQKTAERFGLHKKDFKTLQKVWALNANTHWGDIHRLMSVLGVEVENTKKGLKYTSPTGRVLSHHPSHKGGDSRIDYAFLNDLKDMLRDEGYVEGMEDEKEKVKQFVKKDDWPKIRTYSSQEEAESKIEQGRKEFMQKSKGEDIEAYPIGMAKDSALVYAIFKKGDNFDWERAQRKAREKGVDLMEDRTFSEIESITSLAGIPSLNETASAGGTSAGGIASGPVAPNKPYRMKKKKKKKGKTKNPYGVGTDNLIRRWQ